MGRWGREKGRGLRDDIIFWPLCERGRGLLVGKPCPPGLSCCGQVCGQVAPALAWVASWHLCFHTLTLTLTLTHAHTLHVHTSHSVIYLLKFARLKSNSAVIMQLRSIILCGCS